MKILIDGYACNVTKVAEKYGRKKRHACFQKNKQEACRMQPDLFIDESFPQKNIY